MNRLMRSIIAAAAAAATKAQIAARLGAALGAIGLSLAASPAFALVVPWSGAGSGGTPNLDGQPFLPAPALGDTWQLTAGDTQWQMTLNSLTSPSIFNQTGFTNSNGTFATAFRFTINSGVSGIISTGTELVDVTTSQTWNSAVTLSGQRVSFDAPFGTQLNMNDSYLLNIDFAGAADPGTFSFAALWSDPPIPPSVPEPRMGLPLLGIALLGFAAYNYRQKTKILAI